MTNERLKARRAASWARGQKRKEVNKSANEQRARANAALRAAGQLTPHEEKKAKRREARDALRAAGLLPPIGLTRKAWMDEKKRGNAA
jgi:hypothetical protein